MDSVRRLATYGDLIALPDSARGEVIDGVLVTPAAPTPRHSRVQGALVHNIGGPFDQDDGRGAPGGWWIFLEVEVRFTPHLIVRPDVAGWRRERLPSPWEVRPIDVIPDWICEVVSPNDPAADRVRKRQIYAAYDVPSYWIIDPEARTLEALRLDPGTKLWVETGAYTDGKTARIAPFDAIEIEIARLLPPA